MAEEDCRRRLVVYQMFEAVRRTFAAVRRTIAVVCRTFAAVHQTIVAVAVAHMTDRKPHLIGLMDPKYIYYEASMSLELTKFGKGYTHNVYHLNTNIVRLSKNCIQVALVSRAFDLKNVN